MANKLSLSLFKLAVLPLAARVPRGSHRVELLYHPQLIRPQVSKHLRLHIHRSFSLCHNSSALLYRQYVNAGAWLCLINLCEL